MNSIRKLFRACLALVCLGFAARGSSQSFLTNGLVLYYPFNGNANDASGNGNNGTVQGATLTTNRFGIPNSAYRFNGSSSLILVPETIFGPTNQAWTLSFWVTTDGGSYASQELIFAKSSANGEMGMSVRTGAFSCGVHLPDNWYNALSPTPVVANTITHVVGVYRMGESASLYLNGVLVTNVPLPNEDIVVNSTPLVSALGGYDLIGGPSEFFHGRLEDFRVYTRALSASEIQQLYAVESAAPNCLAHTAAATATVVNGFVVGATITDSGCGYTNAPQVQIFGGGGQGATAYAVITNGMVTGIVITDPGDGYTYPPTITIGSPLGVQLDLIKFVTPSFAGMVIGSNYQLQISTDLIHWTNHGPVFTATSIDSVYPQYFQVDNWNALFFRMLAAP